VEPWRTVWRDGLAPLLTDNDLQALGRALAQDDPALIQGSDDGCCVRVSQFLNVWAFLQHP
jgi:hypothetical protein